MKSKTNRVLLILLIIPSFSFSQKDSTIITNSLSFFEKLSAHNGEWITKNRNLSNENSFTHFLMKFENDDLGGVNGTISGVNQKKDTIIFWKIVEFINPYTGTVIFIQRSQFGYTISSSSFPSKNKRLSEFELTYANGLKEKHKDIHYFLDNNTIITESEVYDQNENEWIKQPSMKWNLIQ